MYISHRYPYFFFFNDTATTEIYTLSLHDALPIYLRNDPAQGPCHPVGRLDRDGPVGRSAPRAFPRREVRSHRAGKCAWRTPDRKSTRLNSSHSQISYAVFCLKKKKRYSLMP